MSKYVEEELERRRAHREAELWKRRRERAAQLQVDENPLSFDHGYGVDDFRRIVDGITLIGEIAPCVNASNVEDARKVANDWAHLLGIGFSQDERLLELEARVYHAWHEQGCSGYDLKSRSLVPGYFTPPVNPKRFEDAWTELKS